MSPAWSPALGGGGGCRHCAGLPASPYMGCTQRRAGSDSGSAREQAVLESSGHGGTVLGAMGAGCPPPCVQNPHSWVGSCSHRIELEGNHSLPSPPSPAKTHRETPVAHQALKATQPDRGVYRYGAPPPPWASRAKLFGVQNSSHPTQISPPALRTHLPIPHLPAPLKPPLSLLPTRGRRGAARRRRAVRGAPIPAAASFQQAPAAPARAPRSPLPPPPSPAPPGPALSPHPGPRPLRSLFPPSRRGSSGCERPRPPLPRGWEPPGCRSPSSAPSVPPSAFPPPHPPTSSTEAPGGAAWSTRRRAEPCLPAAPRGGEYRETGGGGGGESCGTPLSAGPKKLRGDGGVGQRFLEGVEER